MREYRRQPSGLERKPPTIKDIFTAITRKNKPKVTETGALVGEVIPRKEYTPQMLSRYEQNSKALLAEEDTSFKDDKKLTSEDVTPEVMEWVDTLFTTSFFDDVVMIRAVKSAWEKKHAKDKDYDPEGWKSRLSSDAWEKYAPEDRVEYIKKRRARAKEAGIYRI